jgi:hypothetical protein
MSSRRPKSDRKRHRCRPRKEGYPTEVTVAPAADVPCEAGDGRYDPKLKRRFVFELPKVPPVSDDEIKPFSRLFGDIIDEILNPEDRDP